MPALRDLYNALIPTTTVAWTESLQTCGVVASALRSSKHSSSARVKRSERLGFRVVAEMPEVGRKFDQWLDLVLMQRII